MDTNSATKNIDSNSSPSLLGRLVRHVGIALAFVATVLGMSFALNSPEIPFAFASVRGAEKMSAQFDSLGEKNRTPAMLLDRVRTDLRVRPRNLSLSLASRSNDFSRGSDARTVKRVTELGPDYGRILPSNLSPTKDAGGISAQILDHSITTFFNQASIKNTFIGRAADTVERKLKAEVAIGGSQPDSIQHNIKFQMRASETKASMEYRGITNADLSYSIAGRKTNLEIFEKLNSISNLVFTHSDEPSDRRDMLSLRMHW